MWSMLLGKVRVWWPVIVGSVIAALAAAVKVLAWRNEKLKHRAENAEIRARRAVIIAKADNEIEAQTESRRAEAKKEISESGRSSALDNPDSLWDSED